MARKLRSHFRSNVVGYIALFVALSGTAWAASELDKNEVKSKHIGKGQVKTKDLGKNSVTSPKVADGSLLSEDFASGQLPAGPQGEQGVPGEDATKLFASIRDPGTTESAEVIYGSGVVSVSDPAGDSAYDVTFARSVTNCVVHATSGRGDPPGAGALGARAFPFVNMTEGAPGAAEVEVFFRNADDVLVDTSFFITAFC